MQTAHQYLCIYLIQDAMKGSFPVAALSNSHHLSIFSAFAAVYNSRIPPIEATSMEDIVVVGYLMKPSREEDFAKRGVLPHSPTRNGLIFLPLNCDLPIPSQLKQVNVVLHEATDEIITFRTSSSSEINNEVVFTEGMQKLQRSS